MSSPEERRLAAIMFTDVVGYSALSQRDESLAQELLEEHRALLRDLFPRFHGHEIKTIGDAFLAEFASALEAVQCAIEIQRTLVRRNSDVPTVRRIELRIGIHLGDVIHRGGDLYGDGVNVASRIEPLAGAGGICVSMDVERQIRNASDVSLQKLAPTELKNISVPMELFRVILPWDSPGKSGETRRPAAAASRKAANLVLAATGILALAFAGWWLLMARANPTTKPGAKPLSAVTPPATAEKGIAVLPFVNMGADKNDEYIGDGMTEELLNVLAKVKGLRVPGRTSSFSYKGKTDEGIFRKVGEELHVNAVLEGSVRKAGDKLRITAQLINVADGYHLWSETYDADMKDILAVQSDVAQRVVRALQVHLGVDEARALAKKPTENAEAHRLYLLGRFQFSKGTLAGWDNALQYYNQALQLDPKYALAYCGLADTYGFIGGLVMSGKEAWAKEKELAQKALALDPNLAEAHFSLGLALASSYDWREGEKEIKRAIEMNPNMAVAYDQYAFLLICLGHTDEAIAMSKRAVELEPLSPLLNAGRAWWLIFARRFDEATAQSQRALELDPSMALAHFILGWCHFWKGDRAGAIAEFQQAKALEPQPFFEGALGYAYAVSGDRAKAEQVLRDLEAFAGKRYIPPGALAYVYAGLGDKEKFFEWLNRSFEDQDYACFWLNVEPAFDGLRGDPRFQAMVKKVGYVP